ncbi:MAG TPA: MarR family transcriptional regulator, partial [Amycolatopsis sp.]|nr:MarR family transcriptional regulator [Amycolatopsis sp.]
RAGERDRRIKNIVLTADGAELERKFQRSLDFSAEPLAALAPADRVKLRDLLAKMVGTRA